MPMLTDARDDAWVREQVARLPGSAIAELQDGPEPAPFCGVCTVLKPLEQGRLNPRRDLLHVGPVTDLLDYHAIEEVIGEDTPPTSERTGAECYRRCIQIYRAAGWTDGDG